MLIAADGYAKITDFGLSKEEILGNVEANSFCGTPEYLAPETIMRSGHGKAADWWSFGAIIYEMMTGLPPFYSKDRQKLYNNIKFGELRLQPWLSDSAKDLFIKLLAKDPADRLGGGPRDAEEIKEHSWFAGLNWEDLAAKRAKAPYVPHLDDCLDTKHFASEFTNQEACHSNQNSQASSLGSNNSEIW